jgi:hypothetical protein
MNRNRIVRGSRISRRSLLVHLRIANRIPDYRTFPCAGRSTACTRNAAGTFVRNTGSEASRSGAWGIAAAVAVVAGDDVVQNAARVLA